jgi:hypothetical protein
MIVPTIVSLPIHSVPSEGSYLGRETCPLGKWIYAAHFANFINQPLILFIDNTNWASGEDDHVVARAEYDFVAVSDEEISFRAGDMLNLALKGNKSQISCNYLEFLIIVKVLFETETKDPAHWLTCRWLPEFCFCLFFFPDEIEMGSHCVAQAGFKLMAALP